MATPTTDPKQFYDDYGDRHPDDRSRLFESVSGYVDADRVLYPGSYIDLAPSFHFDHVVYVDTDRRAARFFAQHEAVNELVATHRSNLKRPGPFHLQFHHLDYTADLPVEEASVDLLVSLYAGFVSEHCIRYLRVGGHLLANSSHGDASMASIDPRLRLIAVVDRAGDRYRIRTDVDGYLIPKRGTPPNRDELHQLGRSIAYTRTAAAYLFQRVVP